MAEAKSRAAPVAPAIPAELQNCDQWLCWRYVERDVRPTKMPVSPRTGREASVTDPSTWGTFEEAVARGEDGVGFVFADDDPFCGVDLDHVLDPDTGGIEPWAMKIVERLDSYTEISPSGTGLHVIVRGEVPGSRNRKGPVEMYDSGRFFTITGRSLPGLPLTVEDRGEALAALYHETFGDTIKDGGELADPVSPEMSDEEILDKIRASRQAEKFAALWSGDTSAHADDHSAADQALVSILSFYTQEPEQLDRLFRRSALMRPKWERPDYRRRTLLRALTEERDYFGAERDYGTVTLIDDLEGGDVTATDVTYVTDAPDGAAAGASAPPFPVDALPPDLARFVREAAAELVCREEFVANPMLSVLASAVGAARVLLVKGKWKVYPSLWLVNVAPPSSKKSPGHSVATEPAWAEQMKMRERHEAALQRYAREMLRWEAKKKALKRGEIPPEEPEKPKLGHAVTQDATIEKLVEILSENGRGIFVAQDELSGWFSGMDQYKSGGKGNERQKYLQMWSSLPVKVDRKAETLIVEAPVVNIAGSIQPDVLPAMALPGGADDGMVHRFLFSCPEPLRVLDDWSDEEISQAAETRYRFIYSRLRDLPPGEDGKPVVVRFTEAGKERFRAEKRAIRAEQFKPGFPEKLGYTWDKMDAQLARLSLVLALVRCVAEGADEAVTEQDVDSAAALLSYYRAHAWRVYLRMHKKTGRLREQGLLRALNGLLDRHGDDWRVRSEDLGRVLRECGLHDLPERPEELTKELLGLSKKTPGFLIEKGWLGKDRALVMRRTPPAGAPDARPRPGNVGSAGSNGNAADLVRFALEGRPMFPDEIAEATGLAYGTVKKVVSQLRGEGVVEDTGETRGQSRRVRLAETEVARPTVTMVDDLTGEEGAA